MTMASIDDVRRFWDSNPLFVGETGHAPGTPAFFAEQRRVAIEDVFAGEIDPRMFPQELGAKDVLDVGCGIGFWLVEFRARGARSLIGVDLSPRSIELARLRCAQAGVDVTLRVENAEALPFPDASFDHVNCQGVIHHTVDPAAAAREIARVLRPGGTASISVYYLNGLLRAWPYVSWLGRLVPVGLPGRGREAISTLADRDELVRHYDGAANPIGRAYDRESLRRLLAPLDVREFFHYFFPMRALGLSRPRPLHRMMQRALPFMIVANARKPS
jgi:SAM-dependent methyltransferase